MSTSASMRIKRRYPRSRLGSIIALGCALVVALIGSALWLKASLFHANPALVARVDSFTIESADEAKARVSIQKNATEVTGQCTVIAQAITFDRVGEVVIDVDQPATFFVTDVRIKTVKRATSVSVVECRPH